MVRGYPVQQRRGCIGSCAREQVVDVRHDGRPSATSTPLRLLTPALRFPLPFFRRMLRRLACLPHLLPRGLTTLIFHPHFALLAAAMEIALRSWGPRLPRGPLRPPSRVPFR